AGNVTTLLNEQATRDGILAALDALTAAAGPGDVVVIHFSGHGSQIRDRERDEPDGWDETIVPSDSGRVPDPNRDITDDEIYLRLRALAGRQTANITLLFDCCNSGTITRAALGGHSRGLPPDDRPEGELGPSPIPEDVQEELRNARRTRGAGPSEW